MIRSLYRAFSLGYCKLMRVEVEIEIEVEMRLWFRRVCLFWISGFLDFFAKNECADRLVYGLIGLFIIVVIWILIFGFGF